MVKGLSRAARAFSKAQQRRQRQLRDEDDDDDDDHRPRGEGVSSELITSLGPRSFPSHVKELCWQKADIVSGRDPSRWRRDHLGNLVFRRLVGCSGCLCYDFDHIIPYSKGGASTLDNCQILQATANRVKGNRTDVSKTELAQKSVYCRLSGRDMDMVEISAYGDVHHEPGGCLIQ